MLAGNRFEVDARKAQALLAALAPVVHFRAAEDQATLRWSIERMMAEVREGRPGMSLVAHHLAHLMLLQALRLHLSQETGGQVGWFYALADPQVSAAMAAMHADPAHRWTLGELARRAGMSRSSFARRFRERVGETPIAYLTRWRMMLAAERLARKAPAPGGGGPVAGLWIRERLQHGVQAGDGLPAAALCPKGSGRLGVPGVGTGADSLLKRTDVTAGPKQALPRARNATAHRPTSAGRGGTGPPLPLSQIGLLGQDQGVVDLDAEVADGALQLGVAEQELTGAQVAGALVDQRHLGAAQAVGAVGGGIEAGEGDPVVDQPAVLPRRDVVADDGSGSGTASRPSADRASSTTP